MARPVGVRINRVPLYQSNGPIIFICVFVKISTNRSSRVRSWSLSLHESEIQVQGDQRFFFLAASRLVFTASRLSRRSLMRWKIKKDLGSGQLSGYNTKLIKVLTRRFKAFSGTWLKCFCQSAEFLARFTAKGYSHCDPLFITMI